MMVPTSVGAGSSKAISSREFNRLFTTTGVVVVGARNLKLLNHAWMDMSSVAHLLIL